MHKATHRHVHLACGLLLASSAAAFEGDEHAALGNKSLMIAAAIARHADDEPRLAAILDQFETGLIAMDESPGATRTNRVTYGTIVTMADYFPDAYDMLPLTGNLNAINGVRRHELNEIRDAKKSTRGFSVAHNNRDHFGQYALLQYSRWHQQAVDLAAKRERLWLALFLNAYGDHFLQDYFAPGHIATPRQDFHDMAAVGMHDLYNERGMIYDVDNRDELAELLDLYEKCAPEEAEKMRAAITGLGTDPRFYGDHLLHKTPGQFEFISLVMARSVLDVLDSYRQGRPVNSFENMTYRPRTVETVGKVYVRPIEARIPYGAYEMPADEIFTFAPVIAVTGSYQSLLAEGSGSDRGDLEVEMLLGGTPPPGDFVRRADGSPLFPMIPQTGAGIGYTHIFAEDYSGDGVFTRLVFPIRRIDTQLSVYGGYRWYRGWGQTEGAGYAGIRAEMGYGLLFFHISLSLEDELTPTGLRDTPVLGAGVSFGLPTTRFLPRFGK